MKLVEIDIKAVKESKWDDKQKWAKIIVEQFENIGFLRCINIPGYDESELLEMAKWFHLCHSEEEKYKLTTIRFNKNTNRMYRGYFPVIPRVKNVRNSRNLVKNPNVCLLEKKHFANFYSAGELGL